MSTADTKALIEEAVANFQAEVPALKQLRLVIELELRGRGDIQLFRVEVPGPRITRDIASDAKVRLSVPRSHFNELAREGKVRHWREAFRVRHRQGHRAGGDPQADPERRGEAGGARPRPASCAPSRRQQAAALEVGSCRRCRTSGVHCITQQVPAVTRER